MRGEDDFRIRPGKIRSKSAQRVRPFVHQALAAAQKAGATVTRGQIAKGHSRFGRGAAASRMANRLLSNRSRLATVKARVVRHRGPAASLKTHLRYLQREGVTQNGEKAVLFGPDSDGVEAGEFANRCADDRHHFRFIVSPEDAVDMADLKRFTRDLMTQAEIDLGTRLDWTAVSHWNTDNPHVHVIVRGVIDTGEDLVISRDYIKEGMRARAQNLITDELGPRTELDIHQSLKRQIEAERYTQLDRQMLADARRYGFIDLAPARGDAGDQFQVLKAGRMRKLEALGLADQFAPSQWILSDRTETVLRELGERGDIIKRIHRGLRDSQLDRPSHSFTLGAAPDQGQVVGRLMARGLDDELKGTAYVVIDGLDGQTHHIRLPSLEATGDSNVGSIVSVRTYDQGERSRTSLRIESDLTLEQQLSVAGATWLDRQLLKPDRSHQAATGFGAEVSDALERRRAYLVEGGLARETPAGPQFVTGLLNTLKSRELEAVANAIGSRDRKLVSRPADGDFVSGVYRRRLDLASGRFAVLDDGTGLQLVPWSPKIEPHMGEFVTGKMLAKGGIAWDQTPSKSLGIDM